MTLAVTDTTERDAVVPGWWGLQYEDIDLVYICVHLAKDGHGLRVLKLEDEHSTFDEDCTIHTPVILLATQLFCNA